MSVHIQINNTYAIKSDANQWVLAKSANTQDGIVWNGVSFHGSLEHTLRSFIDQRLRGSNAQSIAELREELANVHKELSESLFSFGYELTVNAPDLEAIKREGL